MRLKEALNTILDKVSVSKQVSATIESIIRIRSTTIDVYKAVFLAFSI